MVGNDIVDIAKAKEDSNWQRPRFLDKLFTENEKRIIKNSVDSFLMVWRFWSMKEAAYKLYTQFNPSRFYNPKKFECTIENSHGTVKFQEFKCYVKTKITSDFIISEASLKPSRLKSKVIQLNTKRTTSSSLLLKEKLMIFISDNCKVNKNELVLKKDNNGIPRVEYNSNKMYVSLTHHGRFGAFAIA